MSDNLTARIEALEARGYVLHKNDEFAKAGEWFPWEDRLDESLTALEQAEAQAEHWHAEWVERGTAADKFYATGAARLGLAEQKYASVSALVTVTERALAEQAVAEFTVEHQRETIADLRERLDTVEAALAAERAHRRINVEATDCGIRVCKGDHERHEACEWTEYVPASALAAERAKCGWWQHMLAFNECDFSCSEYQPRNQAPNVAQQGDERDAEGTGEGGE